MLFELKKNPQRITIIKAILCLTIIFASLFLSVFCPTPIIAYAEQTGSINTTNTQTNTQNEHFRIITDVMSEPMEIYSDNSKTLVKTVIGSEYIPISEGDYVNIICGNGTEDLKEGEYYLYFYDLDKKIVWDIFDFSNNSSGEKNRISAQQLKELNGFQFSGFSSCAFFRIASANGHGCTVLIWDGEHIGYHITSLPIAFDENGLKRELPEDASFSIQLPETAQYLVAKPGYLITGISVSNNTESIPAACSELLFPSQVVDLQNLDRFPKNVTVKIQNLSEMAVRDMPNGDVSDYIVAIDELDYQTEDSITNSKSEIANRIQMCMDFAWEAKKSVGLFKKDVTYHGIAYRNSWLSAHYVGWHVTKQTFMNAANDPDSIFYQSLSTEKGPYYSLVCSSFATLVYGMGYPNTVFGLMHDPNNNVEVVDHLVVGALMTEGGSHVIIPSCVFSAQTGEMVYTITEQMSPITSVRNVFPNIPDIWQGIGPKTSYITSFPYAVSCSATEDIPYNITEYKIKNGSARPFRGDQSVYTSDMDVLVNIKDPSATRLYYQEFDAICENGLIKKAIPRGNPAYIIINPGTEKINLRSATDGDKYSGVPLKNGGIYGVWASIDDEQNTAPENVEFFEWYDLKDEKVQYTVLNNTLITNDVFWYAFTAVYSDSISSLGTQEGWWVIPHLSMKDGTSDYSHFTESGKLESEESVLAFFKKGRLGAYVTSKASLTEIE